MNPFHFILSSALAATSTTGAASSTAFTVSFENPVETIVSIYNFALMGSGALAFGVIVYASIKLGVSGGNPSAVSDARDQLTQAGLGLLLLFGAAIILRTINPGITNLSLPGLSAVQGGGSRKIDPFERGSGGGAGAGGKCEADKGDCAISNLQSCSAWSARIQDVSKVCNIESGGGNRQAVSGSDKCSDGKPFSLGLFQINVVANRNHPRLPEACRNLFTTPPNSATSQGNCMPGYCGSQTGQGATDPSCSGRVCFRWDCAASDDARYNACRDALFDIQTNISIACDLYSRGGFQPWRWTAKNVCKVI